MQAIINTTRGILKLSLLSAKKTASCYLFPFYSQYRYGELSRLLLFLLLRDTPKDVHSLILSIEPQLLSYLRFFFNCHGTLFFTNIESVVH